MAQVMLGITTHQLTFVTSNRTLDFRRNPGGLVVRLINYAHPSSYAPLQLTSNYSNYLTERSMGTGLQVEGATYG